jgi:hypothetical protein
MAEGIHDRSFLDGFEIGEFTGKLKHQAPQQIKQWIPIAKLKDFKGVLQKYNYTISGITSHPSDSEQVLMVADKIAEGTNPNLVQAFTKGDQFMHGWEAGNLAGLLRYTQPDQVEEWVKVENLDAIQKVVDEYGYTITSLRIHPEYKKWTQLVAQRSEQRVPGAIA